MTLFNNTSRVLPCTLLSTPQIGVVLPHSSKMLSEGDIDKKIEKIQMLISRLTDAQPHRKTHGGKRLRERKISHQNTIQLSSERLAILESAKQTIVELNERSTSKVTEILTKDSETETADSVGIIGRLKRWVSFS